MGKYTQAMIVLTLCIFLFSNISFGIKARWDSDKSNWTDLMKAAYNNDVDSIDFYLSIGNGINEQNKAGLTALMVATRIGSYKSTKYLLAHHANPNLQDTFHYTALFFACDNKNARVVKLLFRHGVNSTHKINGYTPLMEATIFSTVRIMRILIGHGADINARYHRDNLTVLGTASALIYDSNKYKKKCRFLKRHGAIF